MTITEILWKEIKELFYHRHNTMADDEIHDKWMAYQLELIEAAIK